MSVETRKAHERNGIADLHMHSTFSDGVLTPGELVRKAAENELETISITDHDSVDGIEEAICIGKECNVTVIPGIELSASINGREIHMIGYFFDKGNQNLLGTIKGLREQRLIRAERIVDKLNKMNIPLKIDSVLKMAGAGSVGRPHIARALMEEGLVDSYMHVFSKFIGDNGPAYEKKAEVMPEKVIDMIANAGGLSILAHPGRSVSEKEILSLIQTGIDGIEVIHPSHTPELVQYYRAIVNQYYLVESGGSDYHGGLRGDDHNFGQVFVPRESVDHMRSRLPTQFNGDF